MKSLVKSLSYLTIAILLISGLLWATGNQHIFPTLRHTVFEGRLGPHILEYTKFSRDTIKAADGKAWAHSKNFNAHTLTEKQRALLQQYQTTSFLIIQQDSLIFEHYAEGWMPEIASNSFSMAKSFVSATIGCAIQDGYITSVQQPISDFIPKFKEGKNQELTIEHLLTMSTGMNFDEQYINPFAFPARANYGDNLEQLVLSYDVTNTPGKVFEYRSGATQLLILVLEAATGMPYSTYFEQRLWQPIEATQNAYWSKDNNGLVKGFCCLNSNALNFARIGQLYLDSGRWGGVQIIPKEYVIKSTQPAHLVEIDGSTCTRYGYSWWLTKTKSNDPVFYARGILGQYVFVIPSKDMVIVRLGHKRAINTALTDPEDVGLYLDLAIQISK